MGDDLAQQAWSDEQGTRAALELFQQHFDGRPGGVWAAPGRVNLIGDHVDYNDGTCLPMALPHRTFVAVARRSDTAVRLVTGLQTDAPWRGDLAEVRPGGVEGWVAYSAGPAWALREEGVATTGFDAAIVSCVPRGRRSVVLGCGRVRHGSGPGGAERRTDGWRRRGSRPPGRTVRRVGEPGGWSPDRWHGPGCVTEVGSWDAAAPGLS